MSVPVADGGDGAAAFGGDGGSGHRCGRAAVDTSYARLGDRAVVELADVSGLSRLPGGVMAPLTATSRGTGELIAAALDAGCRRIVVGIGGSASTDGGAGLVSALGGQAVSLPMGPTLPTAERLWSRLPDWSWTACIPRWQWQTSWWRATWTIRWSGLVAPLKCMARKKAPHLTMWRDSTVRWVGGPTPCRPRPGSITGMRPGAGAAGGVGFAAIAVLGATLRPGH